MFGSTTEAHQDHHLGKQHIYDPYFPYSSEINGGGQYGKYGEIPSYGISFKQTALKFNTVSFCGCIKYSIKFLHYYTKLAWVLM